MSPTRIFTKTEFQSVALGLAIDVHIGRVSYPYAEITLMELRAGQHYERIDKAFDEAAAALLHFLRLVDEIDFAFSPLPDRPATPPTVGRDGGKPLA